MLTLLFLLFQDVPAQRTLEDAIAAFANGDATAREEILKAGAASILPLRKIRDRAPDRVGELLYDLKKSSAGPSAKPLIAGMEQKQSVESGEILFPEAIGALSTGIPVLFDPALFRTHYEKTVSLNVKDRPRRETFDSFCRQTDLDYGFFFGVVLIAEPGRLWPAAPPPRSVPLTAEETKRALPLIPRLAGNEAEERDRAQAALKKFGTGLIPLLEKEAAGMDVEGKARCQDLIKQLKRPPPEGIFHTPGAARQRLTGGDDDLRKLLKEQQVSFKVQDIVLDGAMRLMLQPRNVPFRLAPALRDPRVTLDCPNSNAWALICLATQTCGCDFMIVDGTVFMDTRDEIEQRVDSGR